MSTVSPDDTARSLLAKVFRERGYVRVPSERKKKQQKRRKTKKKRRQYKKGYEVRLPVESKEELAQIRRLLRQMGFKPGKPYSHHSYFIQPVYGREALEWFRSVGGSRPKRRRRAARQATTTGT